VNRQHSIALKPSPPSLSLSRHARVGIAIAAVAAAMIAGLMVQGQQAPRAAAPIPGSRWAHADVVEADSPRAHAYADLKKRRVQLPDSSRAAVAITEGQPSALLLPPSNTLADGRERALQAGGATLTADRSVLLPTVTDQGVRYDFVIREDGGALASSPPHALVPVQR